MWLYIISTPPTQPATKKVLIYSIQFNAAFKSIDYTWETRGGEEEEEKHNKFLHIYDIALLLWKVVQLINFKNQMIPSHPVPFNWLPRKYNRKQASVNSGALKSVGLL